VTLTKLAKRAKSVEHFLNELLPECVLAIGANMNERICFLVEESGFFQSNFMLREGLIKKDRFVACFGVTGLAEGVNYLLMIEV
jgi:hypothetical protein